MDVKIFLFRLIGLYSIIMGVYFTVPIIFTLQIDISQILGDIFIISISWLIIGGLLSFKKYSGTIGLTLIVTQIIIEFLSGFSVGMYFVPGTAVLIISEIGYNLIKSIQKVL